MNGGLGIDVVEGHHVVVFINEGRADFAVCDLQKMQSIAFLPYLDEAERRRFSSSPLKPSRRSSSASTCSGRRPYCASITRL